MRRVPAICALMTVLSAATAVGVHPGPARAAGPPPGPAAATAAGTYPAVAAARPGVQALGPYRSLRGTGSAAVALTFDDGPDAVQTPRLLTLLRRQGVKATFCLVGNRVRDHQAVVRRIAREGHTLCNHSWQHLSDLGRRTDKQIRDDLVGTNKQILRAVPNAKISYFRAPYGNFTARLNRISRDLKMTPIFWDVDDQSYLTATYGTGDRMVQHMVRQVRTYTRKGSIVLGHDMAKPWTITAYRQLLPWLKKRYRLIALPSDPRLRA